MSCRASARSQPKTTLISGEPYSQPSTENPQASCDDFSKLGLTFTAVYNSATLQCRTAQPVPVRSYSNGFVPLEPFTQKLELDRETCACLLAGFF